MPSIALKSIARAYRNAPSVTITTAYLPISLITPSSNPCPELAQQHRKRTSPLIRRFASTNRPNLSHPESKNDRWKRPYTQDDAISYPLRSRRHWNPDAWEALLDRYLPRALRARGQGPLSHVENDHLLPIEGVASVLACARKEANVDLLSYLGVYKERWEAVFWLVKTMLDRCPSYFLVKQQAAKLPSMLWKQHDRALEERTLQHITLKSPVTSSRLSLDERLAGDSLGSGNPSVSEYRKVLGQLWQGLGCMILQAEDRSASNPNRAIIMSCVLQILAYMHHSGILSDSIYNYETTRGKSAIQRPPTLYRLSSRIMNVLSDVAWKTHWIGEIEKAESDGHELSLPRVQPQMPYVGAEVWLDLVLWASIEGGWVTEAAWLVAQIERRRPNPELQWSVVSWDDISTAKEPEIKWTTILKKQIDRSRLNQATGINIANNRGSLRSIEMGARTISREVVLAIMDGLVNTASMDSHRYGNTLMQIQQYLLSCKSLLESGKPEISPDQLNSLILRAIESSAIDTRRQPGYFQPLLEILPKKAQARDPRLFNSSSMDEFSAAVLGLQHRSLDGFARQTDLYRSLQALKSIQDIVDTNRDTYIQEFADVLRERLVQGSENLDTATNHDRRHAPMLYPELPPYAVEAFLDLLVETKNIELGKWLLFNEDIDGGLMSPNLFSESSLQPALLRFATVTADDHLLVRVLENLQVPLSHSILHALLGCQVSLNKWNAVEGILKHFRDTDGMAWAADDAMRIAAAILSLEKKDAHAKGVELLQARGILQDLVQGEFNSPRNQAQVPDLRELRSANQLGRIFRSVTGSLSTIDLGPQGYLGRGAYSISIAAEAFRILLDTVVECHGPAAGMRLWKQWCRNPSRSRPSKTATISSANGGGEQIVEPTASMLRLILRPVIRELRDTSRSVTSVPKTEDPRASHEEVPSESSNAVVSDNEDRNLNESPLVLDELLSIFDWGYNVSKTLGFTEDKVFGEDPASLRRFMHR